MDLHQCSDRKFSISEEMQLQSTAVASENADIVNKTFVRVQKRKIA